MAGWAGMSAGARVVAVLLGGSVLGGAGFVLWKAQQEPGLPVAEAAVDATAPATEAATAEPAVPAAAETAADAPAVAAAEPAAAPTAEPEAVVAVPALPDPVAPALDVVRVDPDGATLIAGKAGANARVSLRLDGIEEAVTQADSSGNFVAQFTLQANPAPRMLTVAVLLDDGAELPGGEAVAIAPIAAPVAAPVVAAADEPVADPAAPAAIMVTEDAVSIVQEAVPADPQVAANVTVDTIAYAPDGAVLLSGRGQADAVVRLYLDNAAVMEASAKADGKWAVTLPDTAPGIYTLRVDQVAADGAVTSRFETPFKRETLEALAAASGQVAAELAGEAAPEPVAAPVAEAVVEPAPKAVVEAVPDAVEEPVPEVVATVTDPAPEPAPEPTPEPVAEAVAEPTPEPTPEPVAEAVVEPTPEAVVVVAEPTPSAPVTITVQPGFTLWGIADSLMGDGVMYVQVFEMNRDKIRDPDLIYPGQVFMVPQE